MNSCGHKDQLPERHTAPGNGGCSSISTERIMQAVEEQRRVSQQLEDLRMQQRQRTAQLSAVGLKLMAILWCISGALAGGFILLLIMQPELLDQTLNSLDGSIAFVIALATQIEQGLSLIPSSSWLLSAAALAVVLMMGLWIRLMRHPQDV
jgi:formate/nitrite transporter FocA (FNT family)